MADGKTAGPKKAKAKGRKIGRNKKWCERYRLRQQREHNKLRRLLRHTRRQRDNAALARIGELRSFLGIRQ